MFGSWDNLCFEISDVFELKICLQNIFFKEIPIFSILQTIKIEEKIYLYNVKLILFFLHFSTLEIVHYKDTLLVSAESITISHL